MVNLPKAITPINTSEKLASIADVSEKTYRMGAKKAFGKFTKSYYSSNGNLKNK